MRGTLFSTISTNIDDKNLTKNREQGIFRENMHLFCLRFWSVRNDPKILRYCGVWSNSETDEVYKVKIKKEGGNSYGEVGRERKCWVDDFVLTLTGVFRLRSRFEGVDLSWFEMKVCEKFDCLD